MTRPEPYQLNQQVTQVIAPPMAEVASWSGAGRSNSSATLLDLSQAVPSYPPAKQLRDHIGRLADRPDTARYTAIAGIKPLRQELAQQLQARYGGQLAADNCFITAGCNQAFCLALQAIAAPGDEVILPLPYYFNHQMWLAMCGVRDVHLPFRPDRGGEPDPDDAAAKISQRTKAIVLVTPNNPTGAVYRPETIQAFFELARDHGIALVLDETYRDFLNPLQPPHGCFSKSDWAHTLVHLYSFSKAFALAGYRVGALVAGKRLLEAVARIMDTVAICAPAIAQQAALYGLQHLASWVDHKRQLIADRRQAMEQALADSKTGFKMVSSGPYFCYVAHPLTGRTAHQVARELATEHKLLTVPGSVFGPGQDGCLRLAFANVEAAQMPQVVERLGALAGG